MRYGASVLRELIDALSEASVCGYTTEKYRSCHPNYPEFANQAPRFKLNFDFDIRSKHELSALLEVARKCNAEFVALLIGFKTFHV